MKRGKTKMFRADRAKLITGRVLHQCQSRAPSRQRQKRKSGLNASRAAPKDLALKASAVGRMRHVALLDDARRIFMRAKAKALQANQTALGDGGSGRKWSIRLRIWPQRISQGGQTMRDMAGQTMANRAHPHILRTAKWWARQDSNLEPRDSLVPEVSFRSGLSLHPSRCA